MPDFESVKAIRGPKLADLAEHVTDVLAISLAEQDEFQVGKLVMASYDFVPYALTGLAAAMRSPATGTRASTKVTIPIQDDKGGSAAAEQAVTLFGPGDVIGLDSGQIVRRYPAPGTTNAEETFHAHIEFDRPELPWAFSAQTPTDRMPAWLALVVFERDEIEWEPAQTGLLPVLAVQSSLLPPLHTSWAWAHAQATGGPASLSARLSTAHAPANVSRLLAARILTQNTNYVACLVPTSDAGRKAGLGLPGGTLRAAWTPQDGLVRLPVYDRWEFRTAPDGDFARLARRLKGVAAPWQIGRRIIDTSRPGRPLTDLASNEPGRRQVIKCALFSPASAPAGAPSDATWSSVRTKALEAALERPALIEGTAGKDPGTVPDLPVVGPRIYARGQRGTGTIPAGDWFAELNLSPVHRVVAGLGTRVVVKDQEPLMQAAWAQVGEINEANRALVLAEVARNLAGSIHNRFEKVDLARLLQMSRPVAPRLRLDGAALTIAGQTARSATPTAALGGSFRRVLRAAGPIVRRLDDGERATLARVVATGESARDFTRPYSDLDGIGGLSATAIESLDPRAVAVALNTSPDKAFKTLTDASDFLAGAPTLATAVTTPAAWSEPDTSFRPGAALAGRIVAKIRERIPEDPGSDVVLARWLGGLAAGLAASGVEGTAGIHDIALELERAVAADARGLDGAERSSVVARTAPVRTMRAAMLRGGAEPAAGVGARLSERAAGHLRGPIVRPEPTGPAGARSVPDSERLARFRTHHGTQLATWIEAAEGVAVTEVRAQVTTLVEASGALALATTPRRDILAVSREELLSRLAPARTVIDTMRARLDSRPLNFDAFKDELIRPIMAAPRFDRPMYQALESYDREWLVPGLGTLPEPELVTLLSTNDQFVEAFLVGLSDEMGRELLWRQYPTDSRGTYFHRFWDPENDELTQPIHRFAHNKLGSHVTMGPPGQSGRAVVVIRGELVRRYPDLTIMALREKSRDQLTGLPLLPEAPKAPSDAAASLFHAMLPPDIMLAGLDITVDALRQPGWWIVLSQHPQAPRFRRKEADLRDHEVLFSEPDGTGANGASTAQARLEDPIRVAFEAGDFLPPVS